MFCELIPQPSPVRDHFIVIIVRGSVKELFKISGAQEKKEPRTFFQKV